MKLYLTIASLIISLLCIKACTSMHPKEDPGKPVEFSEIWGYLMHGEEKNITGDEPFTHICYFSAELNSMGRIKNPVARPDIILKNGSKPEVHIVIADLSNKSLMHFSLDPKYDIRNLLIGDIIKASENFDGIQIDFEAVMPEDKENFLSFLREIKTRAQAKTLSIAVPPRVKYTEDAYSYADISSIADRVIIMAYDEHWSSSSPGPVASLPWCSNVVTYTKSVIENSKIVMGLPLYGRAWQDKKLSRALRYNHAENISRENDMEADYNPDTGPHFKYSEEVTVRVYYENSLSILEKLRLYESQNIGSVSFWRIGQGPSQIWGYIQKRELKNCITAGTLPE